MATTSKDDNDGSGASDRAKPKLHLVPPLDFSRLVPHTDQSVADTAPISLISDLVLALADQATFKRYFIGRFNANHHTSSIIPSCSNSISSSIQYIGEQCKSINARSCSFNTIVNLSCHLGLISIDLWPIVSSLKETGKRLTRQLPVLRPYQEELLKDVRDVSRFTLPSGRARTVNLTHEVDDMLSTLSGGLGISKGVLCALACMETLSKQTKTTYTSPDNRAEIARTLDVFRGWMSLKNAIIEGGLSQIETENKGKIDGKL